MPKSFGQNKVFEQKKHIKSKGSNIANIRGKSEH